MRIVNLMEIPRGLFLLIMSTLLFTLSFSVLSFSVTDTATATMTQSGAAGITIVDSTIAFGSGYFNASCTSSYATLDSNLTYGDGTGTSVLSSASPYCWINTTATLGGAGRNWHTLLNNGTVAVNISVIASLHGEDWLCGGNCPFTSSAAVQFLSYNNESSSCNGFTSGYESGVTANANVTIGICNSMDYQDSSDTVDVFLNISIPKDATSGEKILTITYEALAL